MFASVINVNPFQMNHLSTKTPWVLVAPTWGFSQSRPRPWTLLQGRICEKNRGDSIKSSKQRCDFGQQKEETETWLLPFFKGQIF